MIAYILKCAPILIGLLLGQYLHIFPWSDMTALAGSVLVGLIIAVLAWRNARRAVLRSLASGLGADLSSHRSGRAD